MEVFIKCKGSGEMRLDDMVPFQGGLKDLSEKNYFKLRKSILEKGYISPFFLWEDKVADGHQRLRTLLKMREEGIAMPEMFPIVKIEAPDEKTAKKIILAISSQYGTLGKQNLYEFISEINMDFPELDSAYEFDAIDFPDFEREYFNETPGTIEGEDSIPEDAPTISKLGDIWHLGNHKIMCADCTVGENVKRLMGNEKAKILFTSPPYSDQRGYEGANVDVDFLINFIPTWSDFTELFFINLGMKRKDHSIIPYWNQYLETAYKSNLKLLSWLIWDKGEAGSVTNMTTMFSIEHEWIFVLGKNPIKLNKTEICKMGGMEASNSVREKDGIITPRGNFVVDNFKQMGTVIRQSPQKGKRLSMEHPAVFPMKLPEKFILAATNEKDLIIDPFLGYGTTLIASEKTNRKCFGVEISERYCDLTVQRFADFTHQSDNIYLERDGEKIPYSALVDLNPIL